MIARLIITFICFLSLSMFSYQVLLKTPKKIESKLDRGIRIVFNQANIKNTSYQIDGRDLVLTGLVKSKQEKRKLNKVFNSFWGVRNFKNNIKVENQDVAKINKPPKIYITIFTVNDNKVEVEGYLPSDETKGKVLKSIKNNGYKIVNQRVMVAIGAPTDWELAFNVVSDWLKKLKSGSVTIKNKDVIVEGQLKAKVDNIIASVLPGGFVLVNNASIG